jgi:hypothetical protein
MSRQNVARPVAEAVIEQRSDRCFDQTSTPPSVEIPFHFPRGLCQSRLTKDSGLTFGDRGQLQTKSRSKAASQFKPEHH